jgi:hypothetical protein
MQIMCFWMQVHLLHGITQKRPEKNVSCLPNYPDQLTLTKSDLIGNGEWMTINEDTLLTP